jgi:hypothetical protein
VKNETEEIRKVEKNEEIEELEKIDKNDFQIVDGELLEVSTGEEIEAAGEELTKVSAKTKSQKPKVKNQKSHLQYFFLPFIFLTVALLGGMRLSQTDGAFLFLKPPLVCLIFAAILLVLFFRAGLFKLEGWFSEEFSTLKNAANGAVLVTLFFASAQIFNSLLPEAGLPFWIIAFCFFWTLWNNLFADFDTKKLLKSLGAMFGMAFLVKYLILASLTAPASESWLQGIFQNPTKEAFTWALDLPRFAAGTGYIQFFAVIFYLIGLFLLPPVSTSNRD